MAEGRNELYRRARGAGYDYYTFLDDDIELDFGLDEFEALLAEHRPRRAVPWLNHRWNIDRRGEIDLVKYIDHIFMAVRADCAETILPYTTDFDLTNWWLTGEEMCDRCWEHWPLGTYRFNDLTVKNLEHRSYPKLDYPGLPEQVLGPLDINSDGPR